MSGYIDNLPTANQTIAQTQPLINRNFTVIDTAFSVDHTPMTSTTNQGDHVKVTLITGTDPVAVAQGPIVYSKQVTYPGALTKNEIFFRQSTGDGSAITQLTDMFTGSVNAANPGSTFLPGGVIIKWGNFNANSGNNAITFSGAFPNNCFAITVSVNNAVNTRTATITALSTTGATISSTGAQLVYYIAIGN